MSFSEAFAQLSSDDQRKLEEALAVCGVSLTDVEDLLTLRIVLEGKTFNATIPTDFAHSLWKLQLAYYRMVGTILHNSPTAVLSAEEKDRYKLVFRIEKGSTDGAADLWPSLLSLMEKALDKMESWQILLAVAICAGAYLGEKRFAYLREKAKIDADKEVELSRLEVELSRLEKDAQKQASYNEMIRKMFEARTGIAETAYAAGRDGRIGILKGVGGLEGAQIGVREYDGEKIEKIKRRAARVKTESETRQMQVSVGLIDMRDKNEPHVYLKENGGDAYFKASLAIDGEDEEDLLAALDKIWKAARYPEQTFWAEVSVTTKKEKIISAVVTAVADRKEDLPDTQGDSFEE